MTTGVPLLFIVLAVGGVMLVWIISDFNSYPTVSEVDKLLERARAEESFAERKAILRSLLEDISLPDSEADDRIVEYTLDRLKKQYRLYNDEAILAAMDGVNISNYFCYYVGSFYYDLKDMESFKERYKCNRAARAALQRCMAVTANDLAEILE